VQYLADGDVSKATWFEEMMAQVPKISILLLPHSHKEHVAISDTCLHLSHPGL
jgi:hypothetical protein